MARQQSQVIANAKKAFKYSALPVVTEKIPYITGTAQSIRGVANDLRDWTIRNNPFRAVNGNKDPLIRQLAAATSNAVKAAKADITSGDLTFSRLNKSVRDFIGDDMMMDADFGSMDIDFDTDYAEGLFDSGSGLDDESRGNVTAGAMFAVGDNLVHTQAVTTEAMIGAVEHSTEKITKTQMVMTDTAVTRLITSNMTIAARTSSQIGMISEDIKVVNKNLSLLVEQSNSVSSFINQSQRYMETTEQTLNDIKALLQNYAGHKEDDGYSSPRKDFMDGHFDVEKYLSHIFNNTLTGSMMATGIATTFKALRLELPSFISDMHAMPIDEINPLRIAIEKLVPSLNKLGNLDSIFANSVEMFMARMSAGEYGGILNWMGGEGFGKRRRRNERYDSRGFERGDIRWNGMAQHALMEVIPGYLSNMEGYLKQIAINTYTGKDEYKLDKSQLRHYDYDYGKFETYDAIYNRAQTNLSSALQSSYDDFVSYTEKLIDGSAEANKALTDFMNKTNSGSNIRIISKEEWLEEFKTILRQYATDDATEAQFLQAYDKFITARERSVDTRNQLYRAASRRENSAHYIGDDLNDMASKLIFDGIENIKNRRYENLTEAEKVAEDERRKNEELQKGFVEKFLNKMGVKDVNSIHDVMSKIGPVNRTISSISDGLSGLLLNLIYKDFNSYDVGSHNIPNDQLANIHKGEMIIPKDIADKIRAGNFDNEQVQEWLNITAGTVKDNSSVLSTIQNMFVGNSKTKAKTRKAMGAMVEYADDYYKVAIDADAIKDGDLRGIWVSMLENMANQTAILAHNAERDAHADDQDKQTEMSKRILGEKGEDGLYKGTMLSQYANIGIDFKNAIKHAMYGEEYTTSEGVKIAKSDDTVLSTLSSGIKKAGDAALSYVFGDDYKNTKQFGTISKGYSEFKSGITGKAQDNTQLTHDEEKAVEEALQQTADKGLELNKKLIGHVKGGLLGAITVGGIGLAGGGGVIPMILGAGGPIGGALIGAGLSILTRNEAFMDKMFGEMKDGKRAGGIISKEMQDRWKELGGKLIGPAVLGAAGSFIFPKLTKGALGPIGQFMLGTGPIAGAALAVGASLIMKSQPMQDLLYGEEGKGGTTGLIGSVKNAAKNFWNKNKDHVAAMGLGGIGGALLGLKGASAVGLGGFGLVGSIVGMSILGASFGLKATSDKFKDFLFGSRKFKRDKKGNLIPDGRDGDGLIGKISRKFITGIMTPARVFARSISRNFTEWIRYDVAHQLKSAFEPFTTVIKTGVQGIADGIHSVTDKLTDLAKKITSPIAKIVKGVTKFAGKTIMGGLKTGASIAGNVISAPLKVMGHFGRRFSKKYDPMVAANEKKFRFGYTDASGKKHRGFWNPLQRLADARDAFIDSDGGFFDALAAGGHMLNPFTAYADAKYQYSKDTGYNNAAFLGGFFGAAGQKHRQNKRANRRKDKMESRIADATAAWAKDDNWNDKVILNRTELNKRNTRLRKIMGKDYDKVLDRFGNKSGSLTSEEMIQFMYDPFGKKKSEQDAQVNTAKKANTFLKDIKDIAGEILLFVSGLKPIGSSLSGALAGLGKKLTSGGKRKGGRNPGIVDSSMYGFMKAAKAKGFNGIHAIANAVGIDINDLTSFLSGNRDALSTKQRRSLFRQMGYTDPNSFVGRMKSLPSNIKTRVSNVRSAVTTFGNNVKGAFHQRNAFGNYMLDKDWRKNAYVKYGVFNGAKSKTLIADIQNAAQAKGYISGNKFDHKRLAQDTGISNTKIKEILNGNVKDLSKLSQDELMTLLSHLGILDDTASVGNLARLVGHVGLDRLKNTKVGQAAINAGKSIKAGILATPGKIQTGFKTAVNKGKTVRNVISTKFKAGWDKASDLLIKAGDKSVDLENSIKTGFSRAKVAAKQLAQRKMSHGEKDFMHTYLVGDEVKGFKLMDHDQRKRIMKEYTSGNGIEVSKELTKLAKEKKLRRAQRRANRKNTAYTKEQKATLKWIKTQFAQDKDEAKLFPKAFRAMTHAERAEIAKCKEDGDIEGARAKLKAAASNIGQGIVSRMLGGAKKLLGKAKDAGSSIFGTLLGTSGGLKTIAGLAIAGGLIFLFNKFPGVMEGIKNVVGAIKDWFVETAWPFITNKIVPAAKKIFEGIGNTLGKLFDYIVNGEEEGAAMNASNTTGVKKTRQDLAHESKIAANHGLSRSDEMLKYFTDGAEAGMVDVTGKRAGDQYDEVDGLVAVYVWLGNEIMLYNNPYVAPTVEELETASRDSKYATAIAKNYKKVCKARGISQNDFKKCSSESKRKAISQAVNYLNGVYGTFTYVRDAKLKERGLTVSQAAASVAETSTPQTTPSVGSGHFMQTDPRWANNRYANAGAGKYSTMGNGGCGPTALANAAMTQGVRTNPMAVAQLSRNGGYAVGGGTSAGLFTNGARRLGLRSTAIGSGSIKRALNSGHSVVFAGKGNGLYTKAGHIMSARGLDSRGNVIVDDPMRRNSVSVPLSTLGRGMTHAWSIGRGTDNNLVYDRDGNAYEKITSFDQLSDSAKKKDLTSYSEQDMGRLMEKCMRNDPSAGMNIAEYYYLAEMREVNRNSGLRNVAKMRAHTALRDSNAQYVVFGNGGAYIYYQLGDSWGNKSLVYTGDGDTIGRSGCIVSAMGSMLTNITGLNYRPDFMTQQVAGNMKTGNNLLKILTYSRSPSISGTTPQRYLINDNSHPQQTNTNKIYPNHDLNYNVNDLPFTHGAGIQQNDDELGFIDVISNGPFVIYGGTNTDAGSKIKTSSGTYADKSTMYEYTYPFFRPGDGKYYPQHAMLAVPETFGNPEKIYYRNFYLFDPGTNKPANQGRVIPYTLLFAPGSGVQSVFGLRGMSGMNMVGMNRENPSNEDLNWWESMYDPNAVASMYSNTGGEIATTFANPSTTTSTSPTEDDSDDNIITKIMKALGQLGEIALGIIGNLFGGKGKYNASVSEFVDYSISKNPSQNTPSSSILNSDLYNSLNPKNMTVEDITSLRAQGLITDKEAQTLLRRKMSPELTIDDINKIIIDRHPDAAQIDPYASLPEYAKTNAYSHNISYTSPKISKSYTESDINSLIDACVRIGSVWETGIGVGDMKKRYSHVSMDNNSAVALGIKGFNGLNAVTVLRRMAESNELSDNDKLLATQFADQIAGPLNNGKGNVDREALSKFLSDNYTVSKAVQDGYAHQLHYYGIEEVLKAADRGAITSPAGVVLLEHFSGIGPGHTRGVAKKLQSTDDELTNIANMMHNQFSNASWYSSGHANRIRGVYEMLGGSEKLAFGENVGFGGGIADSFKSGAYDIVDTPVAINTTPKVEVDTAPVTTRLDVIINYLRQIATTSRENRAGTAATNLDIGSGAGNNAQKLSNMGLQREDHIPIYTESKSSDVMKHIHDRIAKSPRPV